MQDLTNPFFWLSLSKIVWIDILLSGDNALVIAMVCRGLAPKQRLWGMILGAACAVLLRISLTGAVGFFLGAPYVKLVGGAALLYISIKLLAPSDGEDAKGKQASNLMAAIGLVMLADITMSIDNIVAIAAASHGNSLLMGLGLALSIPLIVTGASIIVLLLDKLPLLVWAGAALLGWIAGELIVEDSAVSTLISHPFDQPIFYAAIAASLVLLIGAARRGKSSDPWFVRMS